MAMPTTPTIRITEVAGSALIFSASSALYLRRLRMVGEMVGCSVKRPYQVAQGGLPMMLMSEQVAVLRDLGLVRGKGDGEEGTRMEEEEENDEVRREDEEKSVVEQIRVMREERVLLVGEKFREIAKMKWNRQKTVGKKQEPNTEEQRERVVDGGEMNQEPDEAFVEKVRCELLDEVNTRSEEEMRKNIFVQIPLEASGDACGVGGIATCTYPNTRQEKLRYVIFHDLYHRGFYITSGFKFGCDYLLYEGDPAAYHAKYMVVCHSGKSDLNEENVSTEYEWIRHTRLGNNTKKLVLVACVNSSLLEQDPNTKIYPKYFILQWTGPPVTASLQK